MASHVWNIIRRVPYDLGDIDVVTPHIWCMSTPRYEKNTGRKRTRGGCPVGISSYLTSLSGQLDTLVIQLNTDSTVIENNANNIINKNEGYNRWKLMLRGRLVNIPIDVVTPRHHLLPIPDLDSLYRACAVIYSHLYKNESTNDRAVLLYCTDKSICHYVIAAYQSMVDTTKMQQFLSSQRGTMITPTVATLCRNWDGLMEQECYFHYHRTLILRAMTLQGIPVEQAPTIHISSGNISHMVSSGEDCCWEEEEGFYQIELPLLHDFCITVSFPNPETDPSKILFRYCHHTSFLPQNCTTFALDIPKHKVDMTSRYSSYFSSQDFLMTLLFEVSLNDIDKKQIRGICKHPLQTGFQHISQYMDDKPVIEPSLESMKTLYTTNEQKLACKCALQLNQLSIESAKLYLKSHSGLQSLNSSLKTKDETPSTFKNKNMQQFRKSKLPLPALLEEEEKLNHSPNPQIPQYEEEQTKNVLDFLDNLDLGISLENNYVGNEKNAYKPDGRLESPQSVIYTDYASSRITQNEVVDAIMETNQFVDTQQPPKNLFTNLRTKALDLLDPDGREERAERSFDKQAVDELPTLSNEYDNIIENPTYLEYQQLILSSQTWGIAHKASIPYNSEIEKHDDDVYEANHGSICMPRNPHTLIGNVDHTGEMVLVPKSMIENVQSNENYIQTNSRNAMEINSSQDSSQNNHSAIQQTTGNNEALTPVPDVDQMSSKPLEITISPSFTKNNSEANVEASPCMIGQSIPLMSQNKTPQQHDDENPQEQRGLITGKNAGYYTVQIPAFALKNGQLVITEKTESGAAADLSAAIRPNANFAPNQNTEGNQLLAPPQDPPLPGVGAIAAAEIIAQAKKEKEETKQDIKEEDKPLKSCEEYSKYFKMLSVGLPMGAVKNALQRDGKDPGIMDLDPEKSLASQMKKGDDNGNDPPLKEDPDYVKYFKMLNVGLPIGAVKNALQRDGKDPGIMDLDPEKSLASQMKKDTDNGPPLKEDPEYVKYFKMLDVGLPMGAVKNALQRDGKDPGIMDLDPEKSLASQMKTGDDDNDDDDDDEEEDSGPPLKEDPDYVKYFKMLSVGLPMGAVKNALLRDGKDPGIMDLDPEKSLASQMKTGDDDADSGPPLKEDPEYVKYFKMLNVGLPMGAVKNALLRDGKDPGIMDLDPEKSLASQTKKDTDNGPPLKEDTEYMKYFKMLKMGLPMGAVKNALQRDGKDPGIMDLDPEKSLASQRKKKSKKKTKKDAKPKVRRKKIYWTAVDESKIHDKSLWALSQGMVKMDSLKYDTSEFDNLFTEAIDSSKKKKTAGDNKGSGGGDKKNKAVQLIDGKRGMNGGIILARLKMDYEVIADIVNQMSHGEFDYTQLKALKEFLPTEDEESALRNHIKQSSSSEEAKKEAIEAMIPCEKYMVAMMDVPNASSKFDCLLFQVQFQTRYDETMESINTLINACHDVITSLQLRKLMAMILTLVNQINTGGSGNIASGFTIDALLKLDEAKAFDKKTSVLQYLVKLVKQNDEELLNFRKELPLIEKAENIGMDALSGDLKQMDTDLEDVRKTAREEGDKLRGPDGTIINPHYQRKISLSELKEQKSEVREVDGVKFYNQLEHIVDHTPMELFTQDATEQITQAFERSEKMQNMYKSVLKYFGEDEQMKSTDFFGTLNKFIQTFNAAYDTVQKQEEIKKKEEKRAAAQRAKEKMKKAKDMIIEQNALAAATLSSDDGKDTNAKSMKKKDTRPRHNMVLRSHARAKAAEKNDEDVDGCPESSTEKIFAMAAIVAAAAVEVVESKKKKNAKKASESSADDEGDSSTTAPPKFNPLAGGGIAAAAAAAAAAKSKKRNMKKASESSADDEGDSSTTAPPKFNPLAGGGIAAAAAAAAAAKSKKRNMKKASESSANDVSESPSRSSSRFNPLAGGAISASASALSYASRSRKKSENMESSGDVVDESLIRSPPRSNPLAGGGITTAATASRYKNSSSTTLSENQRVSGDHFNPFSTGGVAAAAAAAAAARSKKKFSRDLVTDNIKITDDTSERCNPLAGGGIAAAAAAAAASRMKELSA